MEQLELFKKLDYVLFGLSFTMPEPGCFAWYEESDEDYLNPRKGYCYIEKLNDDYNFICHEDEIDRLLLLRLSFKMPEPGFFAWYEESD